jgi:hypothetical protein
MLRNNPEESSSHLLRGGSLKSRNVSLLRIALTQRGRHALRLLHLLSPGVHKFFKNPGATAKF